MTALIELRDIRKSFGPVEVLKGVDLQVHPGRVSALVGDNGAGKSTLIKGLAGVQSYDSGEVLFDGQPVALMTGDESGVSETLQSVRDDVGDRDVPSVLLDPIAIFRDNVSQVVEDGAVSAEELCADEYAEACAELGIE